MHGKGSAVTLLLPSFHRDEKYRPCRALGRTTVSVVKHALSSLIHADKIRPLTKCIFSLLTNGTAARGALWRQWCREVEHLPETGEIPVKYCLPGGELSLDVLGGCPSGMSTPSVLWKLPGLQDSQGQKGRVIAKHESL